MNILKIKLQVEHYLTYIVTIVEHKIWIECIRVRGISYKNLSLQTTFNDQLLFYLYNKLLMLQRLEYTF